MSSLRAALMVATGGLSIPKMGATGFGYDIARQFRIPIEPCRPALVPLTLGSAEHASFADLTGVSAPVIAACGKRSFRGKDAVYASRAERAGDPANLVVLEASRRRSASTGRRGSSCWRRCGRRTRGAMRPR